MEGLSESHFSSLLEVAEAIVRLQTIDQLLELVNNSICELLDAERATVFLYDNQKHELVARVSNKLELAELRVSLGQGVVGHVAQQRTSKIIADAYKDCLFNADIDRRTGFRTRNILAVPLVNRADELVGVFQALNKRVGHFHELDEKILRILSSYVVVALENSLLYSKLDKAHKDLLGMEEMKNKFINLASHELLTPITILYSQIDILSSAVFFTLPGEVMEFVEGAKEQSVKLTKIIRTIINVSEMEYQKRSREFESFAIRELIADLEREMQSQALSRKQNLQFTVKTIRPSLTGNRLNIQQAVSNIIMNAIRFTPDHSEIKVIFDTLDCQQRGGEDDYLSIQVCDTGIGIPPEELNRIFMTFYEVKDTMHHSSGTVEFLSGGLGLGLPIAKKIVEHHRGWLDVSSQPGKGSEFTLYFPYQQSQLAEPGPNII